MTRSLKISVVGAGAAGVFAAAALKKNFPHFDVEIIYDPKLSYLGVGESLGWNAPGFFKNILGIENELDFLKQSGSTYKFGVVHRGFDGTNDPYMFSAVPNTSLRSLERSVLESRIWDIVHGEQYSIYDVWYWLHRKGLRDAKTNCPNIHEYHYYSKFNTMPFADDGYPRTASFNYSFHVNVNNIREVVKKLVSDPVGVVEKPYPIKNVALTADGKNIDHLLLDNGEIVKSDLYLDCTGFKRFLINQLPSTWIDCDEYTNDSTIVGPYFYHDATEHKNVTTMTAMDYGWVFHVPMNNRCGNGYQYNSRILNDPTRFVDEFHKKTNTKNVLTREIKWVPGYFHDCWVGNCMAIGTSQAMIDAFDANSFTSTLLYLERFIKLLRQDSEYKLDWQDSFNYVVREITQDIVFRIQMAFQLAPKNDTPYWHAMKEAAAKNNILEKVKQQAFDLKRKQYVGQQNIMYQQNVFVNTAQYYGIDLGIPDHYNFDRYIEDLGINQFDYMDNKNRIQAQHAENMGDFYSRTIFKDIEYKPINAGPMQMYV